MLMTRMTPKISASPSDTMAYSAPARMPEMITCPIIAGVRTTFMRPAARRRRSALVPGRCREERLAFRQLVGPDDDLLLLLPLEGHHLVRDLKAVLVDLVVPEHRPDPEGQQRVAHLVGVQRPRPFHAFGVDQAAGIAGGRVIGRLVPELFSIGVEELLIPGVRQRM